MAKSRLNIKPGDQFGWLTVIAEIEKSNNGHRTILVQCRCGKQYTVMTSYLTHGEPKCLECSRKENSKKVRKKKSKIGDVINNWKILREVGKNRAGGILYECKCLLCGSVSIKTRGSLTTSKGHGCIKCKPEYNFMIQGDIAEGTLPDGSKFKIDVSDIELFSKYFWHKGKNGYILGNVDGEKRVRLHNYLLGYKNKQGICVDHKNRNKLDCSRKNLRIVTAQQNAMNKGFKKNLSGYFGVSPASKSKGYVARIGMNNKEIILGKSQDPVLCAQMHDIASKILFGEFAGYQNNVPEATKELKEHIKILLKPYMEESREATQECGLSLYHQKSMLNKELQKFMKDLKAARKYISRQQLLTFRGQALAGNIVGARKGLTKIMRREYA
jgi:hypothetical protein